MGGNAVAFPLPAHQGRDRLGEAGEVGGGVVGASAFPDQSVLRSHQQQHPSADVF